MNTLIKTIEDLSLNAWPSHQIELYDGWILRFSYFYTHRTNSVEQIGPSTIPVEEKVQYCEEIYRRWGTPAIFKISPLVNPGFDAMLADRGYVVPVSYTHLRPTVRGSVMNPNDHPHGGGEGKTGIGRPGPSTPWGKPALGLKTRAKNKQSNKYIVRRRDGKALSK